MQLLPGGCGLSTRLPYGYAPVSLPQSASSAEGSAEDGGEGKMSAEEARKTHER